MFRGQTFRKVSLAVFISRLVLDLGSLPALFGPACLPVMFWSSIVVLACGLECRIQDGRRIERLVSIEVVTQATRIARALLKVSQWPALSRLNT